MLEHGRARPVETGAGGRAHRVRATQVEWVAERLSERDWRIMETINRLRLVSGNQLERIHFGALTGHSRAVVRGRVLRRLTNWRVLAVLPRRVGGAARGSAGSVFALGSAGARLWARRQSASNAKPRVRQPGIPTERSIRHTLAVSELYVDLVEQAHVHDASVVAFEAEPAAWWPNGLGGYIKPDAYTALSSGAVREHWWIEVDLATESLPTIKRQLMAYLDFIERGQLGPHGLVPRVLISTNSEARRAALQALVTHLPDPARALFVVVTAPAGAATMLRSLRE